jgi:hypothetical protein
MKSIIIILGILASMNVAAAGAPLASLDTSLNTVPVPISDVISTTEQKVRNAAVRIVIPNGGHGSGSLVKHKGLTLLLTASHVAKAPIGHIFYAMKGGEVKKAVLVYSDALHDIAVLYMLEEFSNAKPLKYSHSSTIAAVGTEITYSGYPSHHQLMTFRGRVAGYEILADAGIQILLHTHGWFGCSGSIVYDAKGDIVGILWGVDVEHQPNPQVIGNLIWIQPIQVFNIDHSLEALCRSGAVKAKACQ